MKPTFDGNRHNLNRLADSFVNKYRDKFGHDGTIPAEKNSEKPESTAIP